MVDKKSESKSSWYLKCLAAFLLTYAAFFLQYPHHVANPNNQTFHSHGDLVVTHADLMYHVKYDTDGTFNGMNYPEGDYIFMTDANGSFAQVFRWINNNIYNIEGVLPGLTMSIIYLFLGFCGMFLFMVMRTMDVSSWLALILAPLITLLAPQMARFVCHLSLSFPFVLPMIMLWSLRKYNVPKFELWDLVFFFVTFFFFMNNAYIGFIMCMFAGVIGFALFMMGLKSGAYRKASLIMMIFPVVITILVYIILKVTDPYNDRIEEQWGFFYYNTQYHSFFYPRYSLMSGFMGKNMTNDFRSIEWCNNLGLVPMGLVGSYLGYEFLRLIKYKSWQPLIPKNTMMNVFLLASSLMVLFAANTSIFPIKDMIESYIDILLMFKSTGRFSWPFYFVIGVLSVRILQGWINKLDIKNTVYKWILVVPLLLFYGYEVNYYLNQVFRDLDAENYLTSPQSDETLKIFEEAGINQDNYQAMIAAPLLVGWNEKILMKVNNRTEKGAMSVMALTGIPMINGRLSRNSTSKTLQATQMSSHPLIKKEVLDLLPNDKPLLIIQGVGAYGWLSFGEQSLINNAVEVFRTKKFIGYKMTKSKINELYENNVKYAHDYAAKSDSIPYKFVTRYGYDEQKTDKSLFGQGALQLDREDHHILDVEHDFEKDTTRLKLTVWTDITSKKYGMPEYHIKVFKEDKLIYKSVFISREFKDIYNDWVRSSHKFSVPRGKVKIKVVAKNNQPYWIDELQLIDLGEGNSIVKYEDGTILLDNYKVGE
ncbi:MAG: hypothetical protein ACJATI_000337 [Halioglobus sp.]|jgi:hypothetical protein